MLQCLQYRYVDCFDNVSLRSYRSEIVVPEVVVSQHFFNINNLLKFQAFPY